MPDSTPRKRIRKDATTRRAEIIKSAYQLLAAEGYAAFSLRQIAARCEIRLATVQHHFSDKATLLNALVDFAVAEITQTYQRLSGVPGIAPEERLRHLIAKMLEGNTQRKTAGFFLELWAMAHRDSSAALGLERAEAYSINLITSLISEARPNISPRRAAELGTLLMAAADGLLLTLGYGKKPAAVLGKDPVGSMVDRLMELALH